MKNSSDCEIHKDILINYCVFCMDLYFPTNFPARNSFDFCSLFCALVCPFISVKEIRDDKNVNSVVGLFLFSGLIE